MSEERALAELLQPSLTKADDRTGFDRPWDPSYVWLAMVLCGMAGGGTLLALNYQRLGMRARVGRVLALFLGLQVAIMVLATWLEARGVVARGDRETQRALRFGGNLLAVVLAWPFVKEQLRRFRIYETGDERPGRLLGPGILAAVGNVVFVFVLAFLLSGLFAAGGRR